MFLTRSTTPPDPQIEILHQRLMVFYSETKTYERFASHATQRNDSPYFDILLPLIMRRLSSMPVIRVLEIGGGRPTFPQYFSNLADRLSYHVHDVTSSNIEYLHEIADAVHIGAIEDIDEHFDLIFSTFVVEHVARPVAFLNSVKQLLRPGGTHAIFCPRYDLPGYLCPSLRHHSLLTRLCAGGFLACSRVASIVDGQPRFWINLKPAVLEGDWYRDADAVHIVSQADLIRWHQENGYSVETPKLANSGGIRSWFLKRFLTVCMIATLKDQN